jgi:hypothetical protein
MHVATKGAIHTVGYLIGIVHFKPVTITDTCLRDDIHIYIY